MLDYWVKILLLSPGDIEIDINTNIFTLPSGVEIS
jgi:hypothetical protein